MVTFGSLFSGIGGFDLGFKRARFRCAWQVEIDENCNRVLEKHWPGEVERFKDVREVGKHNLKAVDVISGGFPCQDLSVAGKRAGLAGERSGLWHEFHRVIEELRPRWVIIENVPGLLSSNGGRDFAVLLQGLVKLRYGIAWRVFDAQYARVPQRRRRVFIVGSFGDGCAAEVLFESESRAWDPPPSRETRESIAAPVKASPPSQRGGGSWPTPGEFVIAFNWQSGGDVRLGINRERANALSANQTQAVITWDNGQGDPNTAEDELAFAVNAQANAGVCWQAPIAPTLQAGGAGTERTTWQGADWQYCVAHKSRVR